MQASFLRIYADEGGGSHFEDLDVRFEEADFVPPAPPVLMSPPQAATTYSLEQVQPAWHGVWHPVPQRLLRSRAVASGHIEVQIRRHGGPNARYRPAAEPARCRTPLADGPPPMCLPVAPYLLDALGIGSPPA